jgi:very-short-patch-repair endonuclease
MPPDIIAQIEEWRKRLLDTSKRSRLVSFKAGRSGGVAFVHPDPGDIWHHLVVGNTPLTFAWKRELIDLPPEPEGESLGSGLTLFDPAEPADPTAGHDVLERCRRSPSLRRNHLLTDLPDRLLAARLTRLALNAHESLTEQGVAILYVAFGLLRWFESPDSRVEIRSPLLLVPVRLERENVEAPWRLIAEEEDILPNHSLAQLLAQDFRVRLPLPDDDGAAGDDASWRTRYYGEVERCLRHLPRWEVSDEAALGTFSFQKLAMWEDLGRNRDQIAAHELCRAIAGDSTATLRSITDLPTASELDRTAHPSQTFHILDADSSQHEAIEAAKRGASLVLDGPPGTGKSQTIANVIAEFLAAGKTVLFVSEKAAALEVVQRRLQNKGLGDFCLVCHSHKANKRDVIAELGRALGLPPEGAQGGDDELRQLNEVRGRLNEYVRELHAVRRPLGLSAYQVHGELARLARLGSKSRCAVLNVLDRDGDYLTRVCGLLTGLADCREVLADRARHPWRGCRVVAYSLTVRDDAEYHLTRLAGQVREAEAAVAPLRPLGLAGEHLTRAGWLAVLDDVGRALRAPSWWDPEKRHELLQLIERWLNTYRTAKQLRDELSTRLGEQAFARDSAPLAYRASRFRSFWARCLPSWWFLRAKVRAWYKRPPPGSATLHEDLDKLARYHECLDFCRQAQAERAGDTLTDGRGKPDWKATRRCLQQIDRLEQTADGGPRPGARSVLQDVLAHCSALRADGFDESWAFLTKTLFDPAQDVSTGLTIDHTPLAGLHHWLRARAGDVQRIDEWVRFGEIERQLTAEGAAPVLKEVADGQVALAEAADAFRDRFLRLWLDAVRERAPALGRFDGESHERLVGRFRELDRRSVASAAARVRALQLGRPDRPRVGAGDAPTSSELGRLLREVNKKRRQLSLRKLFTAIPTLLPRLKPCLMMSPLAVSTYLESPDLRFDLVIFDEASQVRPHDAICAVYRGRQLVVAGDQKQLPPTNFFERSLEDDGSSADDGDEAGGLNDFESVLDICCSLGLPRRRLRWHYRSRREGLIAFANHFVYADELVTFPSVEDVDGNPAVRFAYVPEGRWQGGAGAGFNAVEARRAAELVMAHAREYPEQSLGVIAFSQRQQLRILDELERLRRDNPDLEDFFREDRDEPFFVKNLENVQGDERDAIFLSVAYGPSEADPRRVSMNFGPLNRQGGERRLNVAVTRAKQRMTVVSSLRAEDIDLSRTGAQGARLLRAYLDYAERGPEALRAAITAAGGRDFDSPFEREVYEELARRGLTLHAQIGCSGFRIDLAVVDAQVSGRYLLGVECDGATYHSSATARDRDRLRQEVLEGLGWHICRIWSTDWLRDREKQIRRVLSALEMARRARASPAAVVNVAPVIWPAENRPSGAVSAVSVITPTATASYESIDDVPESVVRDHARDALRDFGATEASELIQAVTRRLGFKRTGSRIQSRIARSLEALIQVGQICRTADQRLQLAPDPQAVSG